MKLMIASFFVSMFIFVSTGYGITNEEEAITLFNPMMLEIQS